MRVRRIAAGRIGAFHAQTMADQATVTEVAVTDLPATDVVVERRRILGIPGAVHDGWYDLEQDLALDEEPAEGEGPIAVARTNLE